MIIFQVLLGFVVVVLFSFLKRCFSCTQITSSVNHLRTVLPDAVGTSARLSSPQTMYGRGRVRLFAYFLLKDECTNADTLFSPLSKPHESDSTSHLAQRWLR